MKPDKEYKGRSHIRMFNMDCMEFMDQCETYNLAIVDPPYFDGPQKTMYNKSGKNGKSKSSAKKYKTIPTWNIPDGKYINNVNQCSLNQIIWGVNYFNVSLPGGRIVWIKSEPGIPFSSCDIAYHSFYNRIDMYKYTWMGFRQGPTNQVIEDRIHPTQKPIALYKWLLTNYANEGDRILDTHGGSLSIAIACWDLGFDLDVCELDEDYFNAAVQRFENHICQTQLF